MSDAEVDIHELKHGIRLAIRNPKGKLTLRQLVVFLANAMTWFKRQREERGSSELFEGAYGQFAYGPYGVLGKFQLLCPDKALSLLEWTDALIDGYSRSNLLEQLAAMEGNVNEGILRAKGTVFTHLGFDGRSRLIRGSGVSGAQWLGSSVEVAQLNSVRRICWTTYIGWCRLRSN